MVDGVTMALYGKAPHCAATGVAFKIGDLVTWGGNAFGKERTIGTIVGIYPRRNKCLEIECKPGPLTVSVPSGGWGDRVSILAPLPDVSKRTTASWDATTTASRSYYSEREPVIAWLYLYHGMGFGRLYHADGRILDVSVQEAHLFAAHAGATIMYRDTFDGYRAVALGDR